MPWRKLGLIFNPETRAGWFVSHALVPVAQHVEGHIFRVYFSGRDAQGRSRIGYFVFDITNPGRILEVSQQPVLDLGLLGAFDDSGVTSATIIRHNGRDYLYYGGWSLGVTVPFYINIGLAVSDVGKLDFQRISPAPVLGRHANDPYLTTSPCILIENDLWRCWYISGARWELENDKPKHYYHVRYAESTDGIHWGKRGIVAVDFASPGEYAIGRPWVLKDGDLYKMWYSYRGAAYRMGYAESDDGIAWERKDHLAGIDVSESGWDSEMIEYPCVFDHQGARYMLYNGNGYGKTGIGLAVWE
jgi:predicted GH43/DUF377 family glycosyl hydrolase